MFWQEVLAEKIFTAGTLVGIIASVLSLPHSVILAACSVISVGTSLYALKYDVKPKVFTANVNNAKEINVKQYWPYRADWEYIGKAFIGDLDAAYVYRKSFKNNDYSDDIKLMKKAIDNYIMFTRGN